MAWVMLHKLRRAMVRPDRDPLKDHVEVDETYIGGPEVGLRGGRQLLDKVLVVGAVEIRGRAAGRVRLQVVPDASGRSLTAGSSAAWSHPGRVSSPTPGKATPRSARWATGTGPAPRERPSAPRRCCLASTGSSEPSRPGSSASIMASVTPISRSTSTSSRSASTDGASPWPPFKRSSGWPRYISPLPTAGCMLRSQPDKQNKYNDLYRRSDLLSPNFYSIPLGGTIRARAAG